MIYILDRKKLNSHGKVAGFNSILHVVTGKMGTGKRGFSSEELFVHYGPFPALGRLLFLCLYFHSALRSVYKINEYKLPVVQSEGEGRIPKNSAWFRQQFLFECLESICSHHW